MTVSELMDELSLADPIGEGPQLGYLPGAARRARRWS